MSSPSLCLHNVKRVTMTPKIPVLARLAGATLIYTSQVSAHTLGVPGAGLADGLAHPFLGLDHLLAMLGVGIWGAQLGGGALWRLPLTFLALMAGGALFAASIGANGVPVEAAIAGSVLALGLLIACRIRLSTTWSVLAVSAFAVFHGYAHGLEMPEAGSPWSYGAGFLLATGSLHVVGVMLGLYISGRYALVRIGGAAIAATGLFLLVGV